MRKVFFILILMVIAFSLISQYSVVYAWHEKSEITWIRTMGVKGATIERGCSILVEPDGSIITVGQIAGGEYYKKHKGDGLIAKLTVNGSLVWFKILGYDQASEEFDDLALASDGSMVLVGSIMGFSGAPKVLDPLGDVLVVKLSPNGDLMWSRVVKVAGERIESGLKVWVLKNDSIVVTGLISGFRKKGLGWFIAKLSPNGELEWFKIIEWSVKEKEFTETQVVLAPDNTIVVTGVVKEPIAPERFEAKVFVAKMTLEGKPLWMKAFNVGRGLTEEVFNCIVASDGSIYVTGYASGILEKEAPLAPYDAFIVKLSPDGKLEWLSAIGLPLTGYLLWYTRPQAIAVTKDGHLVVAGVSKPVKAKRQYNFVAWLSPRGDVERIRGFRNELTMELLDVAVAPDGSIVLSGGYKGDAMVLRVYKELLVGEVAWVGYEGWRPLIVEDVTKKYNHTRISNITVDDYTNPEIVKLVDLTDKAGSIKLTKHPLRGGKPETHIAIAENASYNLNIIIKGGKAKPVLKSGTFRVLLYNTSGLVGEYSFRCQGGIGEAKGSLKLKAGRYVVEVFFKPDNGLVEEFWGITVVYHFLKDGVMVFSKTTPSLCNVTPRIMIPFSDVVFNRVLNPCQFIRLKWEDYRLVIIDPEQKKPIIDYKRQVRELPELASFTINTPPFKMGRKYNGYLILYLTLDILIEELKVMERSYPVDQYVFEINLAKPTTKTTTKPAMTTTTKTAPTETTKTVKPTTTTTKPTTTTITSVTTSTTTLPATMPTTTKPATTTPPPQPQEQPSINIGMLAIPLIIIVIIVILKLKRR